MIIKKKLQKPKRDIVEKIEEPVKNVDVDEAIKFEEITVPSETENIHGTSVLDDGTDLFNLDNIDFNQRQEKRKGERRRGFRRTDDRNLISRAREEAESIKEAAAKEGYQAGLNQAASDIEEVRSVISEFLGAKQKVFDTIAPSIMEISLDIAKKVIKREIEQDPMLILKNISEVLKEISRDETKITVNVNPVQVDLLKSELPEVLDNAGMEIKTLIVPDETIMEGGCKITTSNGVIDATIETQLSVISEALKGI